MESYFEKMKHMKYIKYTLSFFLAATLQANAQGFSPAAMEQLKMQRLWLNSQNASGMVFDDTTSFSNLHVNYDFQDGNFHRPQEAEGICCTGDPGRGKSWPGVALPACRGWRFPERMDRYGCFLFGSRSSWRHRFHYSGQAGNCT